MRSFKDHLIPTGSKISAALKMLDKLALDSILFVVNKENQLLGSLTDGDVRRGLIKGISIEEPVDRIIQSDPKHLRRGDYDIQRVIELRDANYRIIPILNNLDQIVNVINFRIFRSYLPVDVVIMAGGKGTRLLPLTKNTPKPLLKVGEKPILEHNMNRLVSYGIDDFWLSVNYLGGQIESYFGNGTDQNIHIEYIWESKPLGTIGAVSKIQNLKHDYILVTNSDILTNLDYEAFFIDFLNKDADFSVVTIPYKVNIPYAVLETSNSIITDFKEKPSYTYYSNGGIYLIKKELLSLIPKDTHYNVTDLMENLMRKGRKVCSYPLNGYWLDIGKHEDFEKAQQDVYSVKF